MKNRYKLVKKITEVRRCDIELAEPGFTFFPILSKRGRAYNEDIFFDEIGSFEELKDALKALQSYSMSVKDCGRFFEVIEYAVILERWDDDIEDWDYDWDHSYFSEKK